ncbi:MAG: aminoacyl-tRNA hydrolase [Caldilineaceae bacterium]|nr:aminoacyl-tRNA hydrolase [Caldilineaceae bacterium]
MAQIRVTPSVVIDENEIQLEFVKASGPGGQNVNKVATAAQLRFDAANSPGLSDEIRQRLLKLAGARATNDGSIVIESKRYRSQGRNREYAIQQLLDLIRQATVRPKTRRATRPSAAKRAARLESKRRRSETKARRRPVDHSD